MSEPTKAAEPISTDAQAEAEFARYGVASRLAADMYQGLRGAGLEPQEAGEQTRGAFFTFNQGKEST
jgi:hypothetical protein